MRVVLLEFTDEFEVFQKFIQRKGLKLEDFLIVALEPKLAAYLNARDIPYRNTLPYFNNGSHKRILVETENAMEHIHKSFIFTDENGLRGCYQREYAHYIRIFMNHVLKTLEIISNICEQHHDVELYGSVSWLVSPEPLIGNSERYCGLLAKRFAERKGMKFFNINEDDAGSINLKKLRGLCHLLEKIFLRAMVRLFRGKKVILIPRVNSSFKTLIYQITEHEKDIMFLSIDSQENLLKVVLFNLISFVQSYLLRKQPRYFVLNTAFLHPVVRRQEKDALLQAMDRLVEVKEKGLFRYCEVAYCDLIKKKVKLSLKPHMLQMLSYSHTLRYIFERWEKSLVMSYVNLGVMAVAGELARAMGRESLFISHGTHPVPIDSYHELELNSLCRTFMLGDYTHVALCTPVQEAHLRYFKDKYGDINNSEIKTGPLIFASVNYKDKALYKKHLGISSDSTVVTHAVTTKSRHSERFYFLETLDEFLSGLADVIGAVNRLDNVKLIVRIHPGFYLSDEEIKAFLPKSDKYIIHREGPFSQVLGATDMLISYSSTTIDEALINRIPVLLYDKWRRYNHFATGIFESNESTNIFPVCYVNDNAKLTDALQYIISRLRCTREKDINVKSYCYNADYSKNLYKFIKESL